MITLVSGETGGGKTYTVVSEVILPALRARRRTVVTNFPLRLDEIRRVLPYLPFIFHDPDMSLSEFRRWTSDNRPDLMLLTAEQIAIFYKVSPPNSIVVLDELYQFLGAKCDIPKPQQKELLAYFRQHRHYKDDVYLVSHNAADIVVDCRRSILAEWRLRNSRKRQICNAGPLAALIGWNWPIQFFMLAEYVEGSKEPEVERYIFPKAEIYALYDSYALADDISGKQLADHTAESSDTGFRFWDWWWAGFVRSSGAWCALVVLCAIGWGFYDKVIGGYKRNSKKKQPEKVAKRPAAPVVDYSESVLADDLINPEETSNATTLPSPPAPPVYQIVFLAPDGIRYRVDGGTVQYWQTGTVRDGQRLVYSGGGFRFESVGGVGIGDQSGG